MEKQDLSCINSFLYDYTKDEILLAISQIKDHRYL